MIPGLESIRIFTIFKKLIIPIQTKNGIITSLEMYRVDGVDVASDGNWEICLDQRFTRQLSGKKV